MMKSKKSEVLAASIVARLCFLTALWCSRLTLLSISSGKRVKIALVAKKTRKS